MGKVNGQLERGTLNPPALQDPSRGARRAEDSPSEHIAIFRYYLGIVGCRYHGKHPYNPHAARMELATSRVFGVEPAMVRYRLGCRRGGNGRRGGITSLWASARVGSSPTVGTAAPAS